MRQHSPVAAEVRADPAAELEEPHSRSLRLRQRTQRALVPLRREFENTYLGAERSR